MSEIRPAMHPVEWAAWERARDARAGNKAAGPMRVPPLAGDAHSMAAQLLHGQPFGFTWEDVDALRELAASAMNYRDEGPEDEGWQSEELKAAINGTVEVAMRIAALLPPRELSPP